MGASGSRVLFTVVVFVFIVLLLAMGLSAQQYVLAMDVLASLEI